MVALKKGSICPECERGRLKEIKKDLQFTYKDNSKEFKDERVLVCGICGHERFPEKANQRIEKELTDFRRSVEGLLSGDQMKGIRENLGLKKKEMAALLSVDAKTVGRYENGRIMQSEQINKLYTVFQAFPMVALIFLRGAPGLAFKKQQPVSKQQLLVSSSSGSISRTQRTTARIHSTYLGRTSQAGLEAA